MIRLVIEDIEADVFQTESIVGEYAVANIADVSKRAGLRSISFKLPKTANNKSIFESCEIPTSISDKPYKRLKARLYVDGVDMEMLFTTLENVNEYYNVRLYGANSDLFANLKDLKLADLDLSAYNHHWSVDYLSQTIVFGHPIQYAVIDWNMDSPNTAISNAATDVYMGTMLPCVYENFLVQKVFNEAGYTLDNQLLLEPVMQERSPIIPIAKPGNKYNYEKFLGKFYLTPIPTGAPGGLVYDVLSIVNQSEKYWIQGFSQNTQFGGYLTFDSPVKITYNLDINLWNTAALEIISIDVYVSRPSGLPVVLNTYTISVPTTGYPPNAPFIFSVSNVTATIPLNSSNNYSQFGFIVRSSSFSEVFNGLTDNVFEITKCEKYEQTGYTFEEDRESIYTNTTPNVYSYLQVAESLPDFTQADFIKEYLKKYGSIISINERSKVATIAPFRKIIDNIGQAVDWSGKVDFSEVPKTEFSLGYAQRNIFKYKDDDDVVKPPFTDYTLEINDSTLESEKVVIESKYSATETVTRLIGRKIPQIKCFEDYLFEKTVKPRCLYIAAETGTLNYRKNLGNTTGQYVMSGTNLIPYCYFIREAFPHGLGFGDDLVDKFYVYLFGIIDKAKKYELPIRLNTSDISTFDFLKPVYIKELDGHFYVNKFKFEYTSKKSSIVELIKLL
jgi:hypothetical protein